jgi:hypothetical protein
VTINEVWIGNQIYWTLKNTQLMTIQITITQRLVLSLTALTALLGSGFQLRTSPFIWVPELSPASTLNCLHAESLSTTLNTLVVKSKSKSKLLYDWRFTANQFVLAS